MAVYPAADAQAMDYNIGKRVFYPLCFWVFATWLAISGVIYPCEDRALELDPMLEEDLNFVLLL